jgi:hypothetical protein
VVVRPQPSAHAARGRQQALKRRQPRPSGWGKAGGAGRHAPLEERSGQGPVEVYVASALRRSSSRSTSSSRNNRRDRVE